MACVPLDEYGRGWTRREEKKNKQRGGGSSHYIVFPDVPRGTCIMQCSAYLASTPHHALPVATYPVPNRVNQIDQLQHLPISNPQ